MLISSLCRWLIANGKYSAAQALVEKAAKRNKVTLTAASFPSGLQQVTRYVLPTGSFL
jgi:hypothetical protein